MNCTPIRADAAAMRRSHAAAERETAAVGGPVDRRDHRLLDALQTWGTNAAMCSWVRSPAAGPVSPLRWARRRRVLEVEAGAEPPSRPGEDHDAARVVDVHRVERGVQFVDERRSDIALSRSGRLRVITVTAGLGRETSIKGIRAPLRSDRT